MDKGNKGFLNDALTEWDRRSEEATRREEWVQNRYEELNERKLEDMWGDVNDLLSDSAYDNDFINRFCKYYKVGDWAGIGNLFASRFVDRLYKIAEEEYENHSC